MTINEDIDMENKLPKILIPMIRRTFPEIISAEIVSLSTMACWNTSPNFIKLLEECTNDNK